MRVKMTLVVAVLAAVILASASYATTSTKKTSQPSKAKVAGSRPASSTQASARHSSSKSRKKKRSRKTAKNWRKRGQQNIDSQRTRDIQESLIREHYLEGKPTGQWDQASQSAMRRYQADNGWQSKTVPDSRALIKLGLGPDHEHLLNPESAMTSQPATPRSTTPASAEAPAPENTNRPQN
jgi:SRSO17 transposase